MKFINKLDEYFKNLSVAPGGGAAYVFNHGGKRLYIETYKDFTLLSVYDYSRLKLPMLAAWRENDIASVKSYIEIFKTCGYIEVI